MPMRVIAILTALFAIILSSSIFSSEILSNDMFARHSGFGYRSGYASQDMDALESSTSIPVEVINKVAPQILGEMQGLSSNEMVTVIVTLKDKADLRPIQDRNRRTRIKKIIAALQNKANRSQRQIKALLQQRKQDGKVGQIEYFWIFNGLAVTTTAEVVKELAAFSQVLKIDSNRTVFAPALSSVAATTWQGTGSQPEPNIGLINAPALWDLGFRGQGMVVASMDTGVDLNHPDLVNKWRGGTNSWFDPYGEHPTTPTDFAGNASGHGTQTMGVMVGEDNGGTAVGVAPDAQWIAVKIFNNQGSGTVAGIHAGFQWLLDPDGNPNTDDAPHVVNNSWTFQSPGCDLEFQPDLQALRAAGILPIFAAGNSGPNANTSISPGNNPEAFAVGGIDNNNQMYQSSSRGPSSCGEGVTTFPEIVAPGVSIRTTDLYGLYINSTGTSLAAPHVSGGLALLLEAYPSLSVSEQETALLSGVVDLGPAGPDNDFGEGRLDLLASYQSLNPGVDTPTPTPTPTDTSTNTPTPTDTSTSTPTPTNTPTPTPTDTPTSTPTPTSGLPANDFYLSLANGGSYTVGSATGVRDEDILYFDGTDFSMIFDGSDVIAGSLDLDAMEWIDGDTILMSFHKETTIGGLAVDDSDIVQFDATSLGTSTAGTFSLYFDGSDVGLTTNGEDVDAIDLLSDGRLVISTVGTARVTGLSGSHRDEDMLAFTPSSLGDTTSGSWSVYFDGSDVGLADTSDEEIVGTSIDDSGEIHLVTKGDFNVDGLSGFNEDVMTCLPVSLGSTTDCNYNSSLFFDGSVYGLGINSIDALAVP